MKYEFVFFFFMSMLSYLTAQHSTLNDEFNSPCNLENWSNITEVEGWMTPAGDPAEHLEEHDISDTYAGELYMMPWTTSWFRDIRGALLFKEITGDFIFTTRIIVRNRDGLAELPDNVFSLAGMMIREPRPEMQNGISDWNPGGENYVFMSIGRGGNGDNGAFELEVKSTTNSSSSLEHPNIGVSEIFMRMVKVNGTIIVMRSFDNVSWTMHDRFPRSDFSATTQIGFVTYTDWPRINSLWGGSESGVRNINSNILNNAYIDEYGWDPDIIGRFEFARFEEINVPAQYEASNFMTLSSTVIESLFGHVSVPSYPSGSKIWRGASSSSWSDAANWHGGLPVAGDYVVIPNCSCAGVVAPIISTSTPVFSGFHLEEGASVTVLQGASLNIDLNNSNAAFVNEGDVENHGSILITNATGKTVTTVSVLDNMPDAVFRVDE